jgi:hypothetical protein
MVVFRRPRAALISSRRIGPTRYTRNEKRGANVDGVVVQERHAICKSSHHGRCLFSRHRTGCDDRDSQIATQFGPTAHHPARYLSHQRNISEERCEHARSERAVAIRPSRRYGVFPAGRRNTSGDNAGCAPRPGDAYTTHPRGQRHLLGSAFSPQKRGGGQSGVPFHAREISDAEQPPAVDWPQAPGQAWHPLYGPDRPVRPERRCRSALRKSQIGRRTLFRYQKLTAVPALRPSQAAGKEPPADALPAQAFSRSADLECSAYTAIQAWGLDWRAKIRDKQICRSDPAVVDAAAFEAPCWMRGVSFVLVVNLTHGTGRYHA